MIDTNKLRGAIVEKGLSQADVAREIGINEATFYRKMKKGVFYNTEIEAMVKLLNISNPVQIFFANHVS